MVDIASGVVDFQKNIFPHKKDLFSSLAYSQAPKALFITCSDSRIDPCLITQSSPGELFICRNAGNVVPPNSTHTTGVAASIEYAVEVLKVPDIIICGHAGCGAMRGLMKLDNIDELPHVKNWLDNCRGAWHIVKARDDLNNDEKLDLLVRENVLLQLDHIKTQPYVNAALRNKKIELHGWVYDIEHGTVDAYDAKLGKFVPVSERYAEHIEALKVKNT